MRISKDPIPLENGEEVLTEAAKSVPPPENDKFGECAPWVYCVLQELNSRGVLKIADLEKLEEEVDSFARDSRGYARRDKFPNMAVSQFCH